MGSYRVAIEIAKDKELLPFESVFASNAWQQSRKQVKIFAHDPRTRLISEHGIGLSVRPRSFVVLQA